ncbi:hypothetical protein [Microcystis aeruginosa]|uniref:hypothetical protein n=1 Tax=Microcystis aeruginosa TaxID=1126 RepID=UPI001C12B0DF|nr:hypothetical protein [Microcystis aeruginosa]
MRDARGWGTVAGKLPSARTTLAALIFLPPLRVIVAFSPSSARSIAASVNVSRR